MYIIKKLKEILDKLLLSEKSPTKLALSFCLGNTIAWSPIIPLQTPLIFILSRLFKLNTTVTFTTVYLINNPFTMVPIYIIDYMFGSWLFNDLLKINMSRFNPSWIDKFDSWLKKYVNLTSCLGSGILCFWCLILGGIILAILLSLIIYPFMKIFFTKMLQKVGKKSNQ